MPYKDFLKIFPDSTVIRGIFSPKKLKGPNDETEMRSHKKHVYIYIYHFLPPKTKKTKPKTYHTSKFLGVPFLLNFFNKKKSAKFAFRQGFRKTKTLISISEGSGVPPESGNRNTHPEQPLTNKAIKAGIPNS